MLQETSLWIKLMQVFKTGHLKVALKSSYLKYAPMQVMKMGELQQLRNNKNVPPFRWTMING